MKTNTRKEREIVVTAPDKRGVLSNISSAISEAKVNISAICAYTIDNTAHLRLITEDNATAIEALMRAGYEAEEHDVLRCEVSPHHIHPDVVNLAGTFEVDNNYWCASAHTGEHALLVFSPKDNVRGSTIR